MMPSCHLTIKRVPIIIKFYYEVGGDQRIGAKFPKEFQFMVDTLFKRGCLQYANLANALLSMIYGKLLAIALKWGDIPKVSIYRYAEECYAESFRIIIGSANKPDFSQ
jgi:hypothetical protein